MYWRNVKVHLYIQLDEALLLKGTQDKSVPSSEPLGSVHIFIDKVENEVFEPSSQSAVWPAHSGLGKDRVFHTDQPFLLCSELCKALPHPVSVLVNLDLPGRHAA